MIKTTVVIPNYNGIKYMEDCLTFLSRCRETEFATIVIDNGSSDGSRELVEEKFPWVSLIVNTENLGFCKAVNQGIRASKTPYVLLLNNDTVVDDRFVASLEKSMDARPDYFSISSKMLSMKEPEIIDDAGDFYCALGWAFARGKGMDSGRYTKPSKVFAACGGASIYRREVFAKIGYFDENHFAYLEDIDIGYRARIFGYQNGYCPDAIVYHAGSGASGSRYNAFKVDLSSRNSIYLVYKNMPFLQLILNLPFLFLGYFVKTIFFIKKGFGLVYLRGLWKGICLSCSKEGRKHKIPFSVRRLWQYCKIQGMLYAGVVRRAIH